MAFEYYKPGLDIRHKEQALNLACSFLRPIDNQLKEILIEAACANKIQMTGKNGPKMLSELQFYELDADNLGSVSEDDIDNGDSEDKDMQTLLRIQE